MCQEKCLLGKHLLIMRCGCGCSALSMNSECSLLTSLQGHGICLLCKQQQTFILPFIINNDLACCLCANWEEDRVHSVEGNGWWVHSVEGNLSRKRKCMVWRQQVKPLDQYWIQKESIWRTDHVKRFIFLRFPVAQTPVNWTIGAVRSTVLSSLPWCEVLKNSSF